LATAGFLLGVQLLELSPHIISGCKGGDGHNVGNEQQHKHQHEHHHEHQHEHHHEHQHEEQHKHHDHDNSSMLGFLVAGFSFIFLLGIDTIVLKHKHCDEERDKEKHSHSHEDEHHNCDGHLEQQIKMNINDNKTTITKPVTVQKVEIPEKSTERLGCCDTSMIKNTSSRTQVFIYVLGISIHSFFEGLAFKSVDKIGSLEIGLIFHKVLESFALGIPLFTSGFKLAGGLILATFYSSLTPIGIVIGASFGSINDKIMSVFNGLALGSIMFMVFIEMIPSVFDHSKGDPFYKILTLFFGYLMSATVIYLSHTH